MDVIEQGKGKLFMDPDPDKAREFFRKKQRRMVRKDTSLKEAVEKFVIDGDYLAIGGFGANRTPLAACHEIVRQKKKNLGFAGHTATHDMQILSAGKVYNKLDVAYVVGLEARGLSKCSRKYLESGEVEIVEWTNYCLTQRLKAAAMGLPYILSRNIMGTDTFKYSASKIVKCPYTGKKVALMPALYPDVSFIHVHEADVYGNARFKGIATSDLDLASASKKLVITTEKIINSADFRKDPKQTDIPFFMVDAVCEVPYGAYPGTMPYEYFSDEKHLKEWLTVEKDEKQFEEFIEKNIYSCKDNEEYIMKNGGIKNMVKLRNLELLLEREK